MQPKLGDFIFKFLYIFSDLQSQIYSFIYGHAPDFSDPVCFFLAFRRSGRNDEVGKSSWCMLKLNETTIAKKLKYQAITVLCNNIFPHLPRVGFFKKC